MPRSVKKRSGRSQAEKARIKSLTQSRCKATVLQPSATPEPTEVPPLPSSTPTEAAQSTPSTPSAQAAPVQSESASKRKLCLFAEDSSTCGAASHQALPTTMVNLNTLLPLFENMTCEICSAKTVTLVEGPGSKAFAIHLQLTCSTCGHISKEVNTSDKRNGRVCDINRSVIATGLTMGLPHVGLQKLCEGIGMPGLHHKTYTDHVDQIFKSVPKVADVILSLSREKVRRFYEELPDRLQDDGILNIEVSFDGSWPKRGHTSKLGFGAVIDLHTGLVVDFHVLSLHCQVCASTGQAVRKAEGETAFNTWLQTHKDAGNCQQNYVGSSGGMEVAAALELWKRSTKHRMRYTTLLEDGDSKTHLALVKEQPYGPKWPIRKEECVNHVSKRLNSGMRTLKSSLTKQSIRIGGKKKGSLTDAKIGKLQCYYTRAVRGHNDTVEDMSRAIWAAYHHSTGQHHDCPVGIESWCWFQRDIAAGISQPTLGERTQATFLNELTAKHVRGVYQRLTDPDLLSKCLMGKTQNANESLHSTIWLRCPKHLWSGYKKVYIACLIGVGEFNMGSLATRIFLDGVGCRLHDKTFILGERRDRKRVMKAERATSEDAKRRREMKKSIQQREQERYREMEGGPSYSAGAFH